MPDGSNRHNVAILVLTCDKYFEVAELTLGLLRYLWESPPEIFVCGLTRQVHQATVIPFSVDSRDWMGIAHQASISLLAQGYEYCYLILDDHPPVAPCNSRYLNCELPAMVERIGATVVSLVGWDQIRVFRGIKLGPEKQFWLRNDMNYKWLFNLHPGCWNISILKHILELLMALGQSDHSARMFEALAGSKTTALPEHYRQGSYRICGDHYAMTTAKWFGNTFARKGILKALHGIRLSGKWIGGDKLLSKIDERAKIYTDYLNGPYPMFWSGLMQKGKVHDNAVRFLRLAGLDTYADAAEQLKHISTD